MTGTPAAGPLAGLVPPAAGTPQRTVTVASASGAPCAARRSALNARMTASFENG